MEGWCLLTVYVALEGHIDLVSVETFLDYQEFAGNHDNDLYSVGGKYRIPRRPRPDILACD